MATKKRERKVYFFKVEISNDVDFKNLLLNRAYHNSIKIDGKDIELKFPEDNNDNTVTGTFVGTKRDGIPPKHKVDTDDYSPVELEDGQGLAYPNAILYCEKFKCLLIEYNQFGVFTKHIIEFFESNFSGKNGFPNFTLELNEVLSVDTYRKIRSFSALKKVNFKVANPTQIIQDEVGVHGPLKGFAGVAKEMNATNSMEITLISELLEGGLNKNSIESLLDGIVRVKEMFPLNKFSSRIKVEGVKQSERNPEITISEEIDLFLNRLTGSFPLEEPPILDNIQHLDRKRGIIDVFDRKKSELNEIFKN